jgi:hypothetical protein
MVTTRLGMLANMHVRTHVFLLTFGPEFRTKMVVVALDVDVSSPLSYAWTALGATAVTQSLYPNPRILYSRVKKYISMSRGVSDSDY